MADLELLCIDLQNDFATEGGKCYTYRPSVDFVKNTFIPYVEESGIGINEIVSDYRQPRPGDDRDCCRPGEWGFESLIPLERRKGKQWIKTMNSPIWTRAGAGIPMDNPGLPFQDPVSFGNWLLKQIGGREDVGSVVVFGLTADCCVLAGVQELKWRGYEVSVLSEATDVRSGDQEEKKRFLSGPPFTFWGKAISFEELRKKIGSGR
ncbi:MAG: cysteine hydrolase family protein [Thermoplasmatota archaeon]